MLRPSGFFSNITVPDWIETSSVYKRWKKVQKGGVDSKKDSKESEGAEDSEEPVGPNREPLIARLQPAEDEEDGGIEPAIREPSAPHPPDLALEGRGWCPKATLFQLSHLSHVESSEQRRLVVRLVRVLSAYAKTDPEVGYCQGMSDLAIPFLVLFTTPLTASDPSGPEAESAVRSGDASSSPQRLLVDDQDDPLQGEALAFWCFHSLMKRVRQNFLPDDNGVFAVLSDIGGLVERLDPPLHYKLKALRATDCRFAYRMIVVLFRREVPLHQALTLWEILWADALMETNASSSASSPPCPDLLSCFVAATVISQRRSILDSCRDSDDLLKHFQSSSMRVNLKECLGDAKEFRVRLKTLAARPIASPEAEGKREQGDGEVAPNVVAAEDARPAASLLQDETHPMEETAPVDPGELLIA